MGTTATYYFVQNSGFTPNQWKERLHEVCSVYAEKESDLPAAFLATLSPKEIQQARIHEAEFLVRLHQAVRNQALSENSSAVLAYRSNAHWLPFWESSLCNGYIASRYDTQRLSQIFQTPILAFSLLDSDVLLISYSNAESGIQHHYAKPNFDDNWEDVYDTELYCGKCPDFLSAFCNKAALEQIWNFPHEIFAEDRLEKLCRLLHLDLLYDGNCVLADYQQICIP